MANQKNHKFMKKLDRCYNVVLQSSAKGISAVEIARKLGVHRTTVHGYLTSLELMGKVYSERGTWRVKTGEQTIKPLEKEIVIELPLPKDQAVPIGLLEMLANESERRKFPRTAETYRILLETLRETRTIKIKGKNVDDLDLERLGNMIQQASKKRSKVNLRGLFKRLKSSHANNAGRTQTKPT